MKAPEVARVITPDDQYHKIIQDDVESHLGANGFRVDSSTYHDCMGGDIAARLARQTDQTSLVIRTRADRVASHKWLNYSCLLEYKSISGKYDNLVIEALPFAVHRDEAERYETRCLYVFRDFVIGREYEACFWADDPVRFDMLFFANRHKGTALERCLLRAFPKLRTTYLPRINGSGDPFIRLPRKHFNSCTRPNWREAIIADMPGECCETHLEA